MATKGTDSDDSEEEAPVKASDDSDEEAPVIEEVLKKDDDTSTLPLGGGSEDDVEEGEEEEEEEEEKKDKKAAIEKSEEDKKEASKREQIKKDFDDAAHRAVLARNFRLATEAATGPLPIWTFVGPGKGDEPIDVVGLSTFALEDGKYKDGIYHCENVEIGFDIHLKGNSATLTPPPKNMDEFKKGYKALIEFLGVAKGTRSITLDWNNPQAISLEKIDAIYQIAREHNPPIEVVLGKNIRAMLAANKENFSDSWTSKDYWLKDFRKVGVKQKELTKEEAHDRRVKYYGLELKSKEEADKARSSDGLQNEYDAYKFDRAKKKMKDKPRLPKADGFDPAAYVKEKYAAEGLTKSKKTEIVMKKEVIKRELKGIDGRREELRTEIRELQKDIENYDKKIGEAKDGPTLDAIKNKIDVNQQARKKLLASLELEGQDLARGHTIWREEFKKVYGEKEPPPLPKKEDETYQKAKKEMQAYKHLARIARKDLSSVNEEIKKLTTQMDDVNKKVQPETRAAFKKP